MSAFSNYAISLSIICILAGGITSFHIGSASVGGAAIGLGWPLVCLFSLAVAATMGQVASGVPHRGRALPLGVDPGRPGLGLDDGVVQPRGARDGARGHQRRRVPVHRRRARAAPSASTPPAGARARRSPCRSPASSLITASQALVNHLGIRAHHAPHRLQRLLDPRRRGCCSRRAHARLRAAPRPRAPRHASPTTAARAAATCGRRRGSMAWLFLLGFLLPAYTVTGFDASAHTAEETVGAAVDRAARHRAGRCPSPALFGWVMLVRGRRRPFPTPTRRRRRAAGAFTWIVGAVLPAAARRLRSSPASRVAQYLCGLATVTSASRMAYAFARDGGLPALAALRAASVRRATARRPPPSGRSALAAAVHGLHAGLLDDHGGVRDLPLHLLRAADRARARRLRPDAGRRWARGVWARWYRPLAAVSVIGCLALIAIGVQPPNEKASGSWAACCCCWPSLWFAGVKDRFHGSARGPRARYFVPGLSQRSSQA